MHANPCTVFLIAGFLGSGKTTLLTHIMSWPKLPRTAILVNEFGTIGIDGELLGQFDADVVELANGCICCSLQADFRRSVGDILARFRPERLLIEATGVADPHDIIALLNDPEFRERLRLAKTVTVVDADFWEGREHLGPLFFNQIKAADLILLNKIDLHPANRVAEFISELQQTFPSSSIMPTCRCRIDPDALWERKDSGDQFESLLPMFSGGNQEESHEHRHGESDAQELGFVNFSFETSARISEERFRSFMASLPAHLYRVKGFVSLERGWVFINHVGGKTEWIGSEAKEGSKLALVGWQVDEEALLADLGKCLMD